MKNKDPHPKGRIVNDAIVVFGIDHCIVDEDLHLIPQGADMVRQQIDAGNFLIFTSLRAFSRADETSKWLQETFDILPFHDFTILMRRDDDERPRVEVKKEFANFIGNLAVKDQLQIPVMFDADKEVVMMYQSMGFAAAVLNARTGTDEQDIIEEQPLPPPPIITASGAVALQALFPDGIVLRTAEDHTRYQMFGIFLASITRFAVSGFSDKLALREMAEMVKIMNR